MHKHHDIFLEAIHIKKHLSVCFDAQVDGVRTRNCIPYDFGPSKKYKDQSARYHFYDLDSPNGKHNLSILPNQIISIAQLDVDFNPADYISWSPTKWVIVRDWGTYS